MQKNKNKTNANNRKRYVSYILQKQTEVYSCDCPVQIEILLLAVREPYPFDNAISCGMFLQTDLKSSAHQGECSTDPTITWKHKQYLAMYKSSDTDIKGRTQDYHLYV